MKRSWRRHAIAGVIVGGLIVLSATPASAGTLSPPYDFDGESSACHPGAQQTCTATAGADAATGAIRTNASISSPVLTSSSGNARADGWVEDVFRPNRKARTVTVTATIHVVSAEAAATGDPTTNAAVSLLELQVFVNAAPSDAVVSTSIPLVDTDPATEAPSSIHDGTLTLTAVLTLEPGQKLDGNGTLLVRANTAAASRGAITATSGSVSMDLAVARFDVTSG